MIQKWKATTFEVCDSYAEDIIGKMREDERFIAVCQRAATLGLEVDVTHQHIYLAEGEYNRYPISTYEGRVPKGYAMVIWVDLVKDGYVVCCGDKENPIQLSTSATVAKYMGLTFTKKVIFLNLDELAKNEPIFEMLEEYLDLAEEHGTTPSLFVRDGLAPQKHEGNAHMMIRAEVDEGSYVEFSRGGEGTGAEDSLYMESGAFMPYHLIVYGATGKTLGSEPLTLSGEETAALHETLTNLPYEAKQCDDFSALLVDALGVASMAPTPRMAQFLNELTYLRYWQFLEDVKTLAVFVEGLIDEEKTLTIIP